MDKFSIGDYIVQKLPSNAVVFGRIIDAYPNDSYKLIYKMPNSKTLDYAMLDMNSWKNENKLPVPEKVDEIAVPDETQQLIDAEYAEEKGLQLNEEDDEPLDKNHPQLQLFSKDVKEDAEIEKVVNGATIF